MYSYPTTTRFIFLFLCACVVSCVSHPTIRTDRDPEANLAAYRTFVFFEPLTTDQKGYSTLLSARLRDATRRELQKRGYRYDESAPDLLVNFNVNIHERQELRVMPRYSYYDYRYGLYGAWPGFPEEFYSVTYAEGTLIIDLVDAQRRQLVWQGLATGRITDAVLKNPGTAVERAVAEIFAKYPALESAEH